MAILYNDSRYTYEHLGVDYGSGIFHVPALTGVQQSGGPAVLSWHYAPARRTLSGNQPVLVLSTYETVGTSYNEPGVLYEGVEPGRISWHGTYHRALAGNQPFGSASLAWKWRPYSWAEYTWDIGSTPESTIYAMSVDHGDQVQYEHTQAHDDPRIEAEYQHIPMQPHTRDGA